MNSEFLGYPFGSKFVSWPNKVTLPPTQKDPSQESLPSALELASAQQPEMRVLYRVRRRGGLWPRLNDGVGETLRLDSELVISRRHPTDRKHVGDDIDVLLVA